MALQPLTGLYPAIWAKPPPSKTKITSLVQIQYEVFDNADGTGGIIARNIFANTEDPEYKTIDNQRLKAIFRLATWMQWILAEVHLDAQETDKAFKRTLSYYIGFYAKLLDDFIDGVADNLYKWLFIQHRVGKQNPEAVRSSGLSRIDMLWQATNCQLEATTREVALRWGFAHLHSKMCFGDLGPEDRAKIKKYAREWIRNHSIATVKKANPQGRLLQAVSSTSRMAEVLPPSARTEKKNIKEEDDKPDMRNSSQTDETEEQPTTPPRKKAKFSPEYAIGPGTEKACHIFLPSLAAVQARKEADRRRIHAEVVRAQLAMGTQNPVSQPKPPSQEHHRVHMWW